MNDSSIVAVRDDDGNPVGTLPQKLKPPNGVPANEWAAVIEFAVENFRLTAGMGAISRSVLEARDIDEVVSKKTWGLIFDYQHGQKILQDALVIRGVLPLGLGLSAEQNLAIEILSDPMQGSLTTRLKKANLTKTKLDKWLLHKPFADQLNMLAQRRMNASRGFVDVALTANAVEGNMDAIKYFDKRVGRDPDKKEQMDSQMVIQIVLDALTKHLSGSPDDVNKLRAIAAEIEVRTKLNGNPNNPSGIN